MHRARLLALICLVAVAQAIGPAFADDKSVPFTIRITSPLGRTGIPGPVRIVAQIAHREDTTLGPVRFFMDGQLLGEDGEGPAYAVVWNDDNPFLDHTFAVAVADVSGRSATDQITLKGFEVSDETRINSVLVETTVKDKTGRFVGGLAERHFNVFEDGVPQKLDLVQTEEVPTTFALLVDSSQSMSYRMDFVRDAARRLSDFLRPKDKVIVVPFSKTLGPLTGPTDDKATIIGAIDAMRSAGGTAIYDALIATAKRMDGLEGRHAIVLLTDGYDENSKHTRADALAAVRKADATIYSVGIGGTAGISLEGRDMLKVIATESGGQAYFPVRDEQLPFVQERVASDVQNRYLLSYTPSNQEPDGRWRAIRVAMGDNSLAVRAKTGYFSPSPPPVRPVLEFLVLDRNRRFVDVTASDLVVTEDGEIQEVDTFQEAVSPVSIVLVLDASGSMRKQVEAVKAAGNEFIKSLREEDGLMVLSFNDRTTFHNDLTTRRESSVEAVNKYQVNGGTALYDAVGDALQRLSTVPGRRVVVVMSDGKDENNAGTGPGSRRTLDEMLDMVGDVGATVYAIGFGEKADRAVMEQLAGMSGGEALFPMDGASLLTDFQRVVESLRRRYVISYTSTNYERDGAWRDVKIESTSPDMIIRSRGGYVAPKK
jgi:Ca-activated chloride channel homolog